MFSPKWMRRDDYAVYALVFTKTNKVVYIGSTNDESKRAKNHLKHTFQRGKNTRVAKALGKYSPRDDYFAFRRLWGGRCTEPEVVAIEQHYMDKFDTVVTNRPIGDIDILNSDDVKQLNVNRACTNKDHVDSVRVYIESTIDPQETVKERIYMAERSLELQRITEAYRRAQEIEDVEHAAKKRRIDWNEKLALLDAKYKWATEQGKVQLAEHITALIANLE